MKNRQLAKLDKSRGKASGNRRNVSIEQKIVLAISACVLVVAVVLGVISMLALSNSTKQALGKIWRRCGNFRKLRERSAQHLIVNLQYVSDDVNKIASKELKRSR